MTDSAPKPPPRPLWVKVSLVVLLVIIAVVVVMAIVGGEHGPGRHLQGGDSGHTPPVERSS